jgi:hypothetical protein
VSAIHAGLGEFDACRRRRAADLHPDVGGDLGGGKPRPGARRDVHRQDPAQLSGPISHLAGTLQAAPSNNGALRGVRVLLVDDEPDAIELTTAVLAMAGAGVTAVTSTEEALTAVERVKPDVPAE